MNFGIVLGWNTVGSRAVTALHLSVDASLYVDLTPAEMPYQTVI